jgi:ABC-type transport system involved in multi-copper enzyme maturation permease subunit
LIPIWLLSVGVTVGAVILAVLWGVTWLISRQAAVAAWRVVQEGVLSWVTYIGLALVAINLLLVGWSMAVRGEGLVPYREVLSAAGRVWAVGSETVTANVPAGETNYRLPVSFIADELARFSISSDQDVSLSTAEGTALSEPLIVVEGGEPYEWRPGARRPRAFSDSVEALYLANTSSTPAQFRMQLTTDVTMPQIYGVVKTAIFVVGLYLVYLLIHAVFPKVSIIATATAKEAVAQPLFWLSLAIGGALLIGFVYVPYNTFGEDVKMLKESGMTLITVLAIVVGLWTASVSVSEEIEGRTALTVLSKPVSRRQFILGKFLGIIWPILLMFVVLGLILLVTVSFKVVYDARETSQAPPNWQLSYDAMFSTVPGLFLSFLEAIVLAAVSVAISTRLSMLPNLIICGSIYVLGHLGPLIAKSSAGEIVFVSFIGQLIAIALPVLDHFNIQAAIAGGRDVPLSYLGWATLYAALYSSIAMLLALLLFEDRDVA